MRYWALGLLFVIALLLCGNGLMAWRVNSNLTTKVAAIRTSGAPASIADLKPKPIPATANAGTYLDLAAARLEAFDAAFAKLPEAVIRSTGGSAASVDAAPPLTEEEKLAAIDALLEEFQDVEPLVAQAAACPDYASAANFSLPFDQFIAANSPGMSALRAANRLTMLRMRSLAAHGKPDEAIALGVQMLRLSWLYEREPGIMHFMVTIAARGVAIREMAPALAAGGASQEMRAKLESELARHDDYGKLERAMILERALTADAAESTTAQVRTGVGGRLFGWAATRHYIGPLDYYDALLPKLARPWHEMHRSVGTMQVRGEYGVLANTVAPMVVAAYGAFNRDIAMIRSLRVLNALEAFTDENGRAASGLEELSLSDAATLDPFSGKPLLVKRTDRGWIVYSVGKDGKDDGGKFDEMLSDFGVASGTK